MGEREGRRRAELVRSGTSRPTEASKLHDGLHHRSPRLPARRVRPDPTQRREDSSIQRQRALRRGQPRPADQTRTGRIRASHNRIRRPYGCPGAAPAYLDRGRHVGVERRHAARTQPRLCGDDARATHAQTEPLARAHDHRPRIGRIGSQPAPPARGAAQRRRDHRGRRHPGHVDRTHSGRRRVERRLRPGNDRPRGCSGSRCRPGEDVGDPGLPTSARRATRSTGTPPRERTLPERRRIMEQRTDVRGRPARAASAAPLHLPVRHV